MASRNAKAICDEGRGVGETGLGVYLDLSDAIARLGVETIRERYGNLFDMYQRITDEDPYKVPMRIYPGDSLHDGRPLGAITSCKARSPDCSSSAKRISPTTAPIASAPAR